MDDTVRNHYGDLGSSPSGWIFLYFIVLIIEIGLNKKALIWGSIQITPL